MRAKYLSGESRSSFTWCSDSAPQAESVKPQKTTAQTGDQSPFPSTGSEALTQSDICIYATLSCRVPSRYLWHRGLTYLAKLQELPVLVNKSQNLLEVKVLLLALYSQVVEGQVNYVHPGQEGKGQVRAGQRQREELVGQSHPLTIAGAVSRYTPGLGYTRSRRTGRTWG